MFCHEQIFFEEFDFLRLTAVLANFRQYFLTNFIKFLNFRVILGNSLGFELLKYEITGWCSTREYILHCP